MSATDDISRMNNKQLRNEVQLLRDELAIMKRQFEDIVYNLDTDNFSQRVVKQGKDMYTKIEQNAEGISLQAEKVEENEQNLAILKVTAKEIESEVFEKNEDGTKTSRITQTAESINSIVSEFVDVSQAVEVSSPDEFKDTNTVYAVGDTYYYYNAISQKWETVKESGMVNSLFEQTEDGFKLKGSVKIDGSCVLTDSLTFNASDRPVQVEYSVDGTTNWHTTFVAGSDKFMRLKIGSQWSDAMKIVGSDGQNGTNGTDATVTPDAVFEALTDDGARQGIFAAFVNNENQIYINAEMIQAGILSGMTFQNIAGTHRLKMVDDNGTGYGTFCLYNDHYVNVPYFSIYDDTFGAIGLYAAGENFLKAEASSGVTVTPYGTWDFSFCKVEGIGSGDGSGYAVFG